ncbi:MAG: DUF6807 family protein [Armatimonadota bacterium]
MRHVPVWRCVLIVAVVGLCTAVVQGEPLRVKLAVDPGQWQRLNTPLCADVALPERLAVLPAEALSVRLFPSGERRNPLPVQIEKPPVPGEAGTAGVIRLWWVAPELAPNEPATFQALIRRARPGDPAPETSFRWEDEAGDHLDLLWGERPVLRYVYAWDPERFHDTYKPFHHLFSPDGSRLITKGPGGMDSHHRGLFIGWFDCRYDGKTANLWRMDDNSWQEHKRVLSQEAGPVFARCRSLIHWNNPEGEAVIVEEREITAFCQPQPTMLLEFRSELRPAQGEVTLDGPEGKAKHFAGFHFRAHNDVADKYRDQTRYLHPPPESLPPNAAAPAWSAQSFSLGDARFTVGHFNHPGNPSPTEYSERDYGRFGAFFRHTIKADETLKLRYRIFVQEGDPPPSVDTINARYVDFVEPPEVSLR